MLNKDKIPLIFGVPDSTFYGRFRPKKAFVAELRPGLEGMKVVAKTLLSKGVRPVIVCDNMLALCMKEGFVKEVFVFYHALNRKMCLCRTGSLIAALCAKAHRIPAHLYPARPVMPNVSSLLEIDGKKVTDAKIRTYVPLFEEVPLDLFKVVSHG
jgi:translation initiation factor 2B subunit (eIF-2B alpha/beta/delta family)